MAWITITESDVATALSAPELEAYRSAALDCGQDDVLGAVVRQVIELARGYIKACPSNVLGEGLTIPEKLLSSCLDVIVHRLHLRLALPVSDERREAQRQAIRLFEACAKCDFEIEEPDEDETTSSSTPRITPRTLSYQRSNQSGL